MAFRWLDMDNFPRRAHFEYFSGLAYPYVGTTANVDITDALKRIKEEKLPFFLAVCYCAARAANGVPELRQRIKEGRIVEFDQCRVSHTVELEDETFCYCTLENEPDLAAYAAAGRKAQEAAKEKEEPLEPLFSVTRGPGDQEWPQPQCDATFLRAWEEAYGRYWSFGQGRKEEMGPPQSDPVFEEGDLPPEEEESGGEDEEAPPLPDLNGSGGEEDAEGDASAGDAGPSSASGSTATVAALVWIRPEDSVTGTRWTSPPSAILRVASDSRVRGRRTRWATSRESAAVPAIRASITPTKLRYWAERWANR